MEQKQNTICDADPSLGHTFKSMFSLAPRQARIRGWNPGSPSSSPTLKHVNSPNSAARQLQNDAVLLPVANSEHVFHRSKSCGFENRREGPRSLNKLVPIANSELQRPEKRREGHRSLN